MNQLLNRVQLTKSQIDQNIFSRGTVALSLNVGKGKSYNASHFTAPNLSDIKTLKTNKMIHAEVQVQVWMLQ